MRLQEDSSNTKQPRSQKSKHRQSSNFSSTEFIIDPQKDDDEAIILPQNMHVEDHDSHAFLQHYQVKDSFNNMLSGQSVNNIQTNQANASSSAVAAMQAQILTGIVDFNGIEAGNVSINEINQQRNQLFNAKEHQSLMEMPQREIQSVYSPSQPIQTPSGNELSNKQDTAKLPPGSLIHLSIDVKAIEDRQKRHSVLKQKLSEMQDLQSQEISGKGTSNDLQSEVAKMGSQIERDEDPKYMRLNNQQQQQPYTQPLQLQQQLLSQYNPIQQQNRQISSNHNNNSSSSGKQSQNNPNINSNQHFVNGQNTNNNSGSSSSNNNKASNSNMPSLVFRQSNNNMQQLMLQYNQQSQQLLHSNHQQPLTNSLSPQSLQSQQLIQQQQQFTLINSNNNQLDNQAEKDDEEGEIVQQTNKNKDNHSNNTSKIPAIADNNKVQKLISLTPVQQLENPSSRSPQPTSKFHNRSSNKDKIIDLFITKLKDTTVLLRKQSLSPKYYAIINDLSSPIDSLFLSNKRYLNCILRIIEFLPMFDEYSMVSGVNAFVQTVCTLVLLFLTSIQLIFQVPQDFQRDYLSKGLSPVFLILFGADAVILLNSSRDGHVHFQDNEPPVQANNFTAHSRSFRRYLKMNFLFDIPVLTLVILDCFEVDMNLSIRVIFFLKLIPLGFHLLSLEVFSKQRRIILIAWFCIKIILAIGLFTHLIALAWFRIGLNQPNNWIQEMSFENSFWETQYAASLFWAVSMVTQMNNYQPKSIQELSFSCFVMTFSWFLMACVFLKTNDVYLKYVIKNSASPHDLDKDAYLPQATILSEYLSKKKSTTHCLKTKALQFMESNQKSRIKQLEHERENLAFEELPGSIKQEIKEQQNKWILSQLNVLSEHFSTQTLKDLCHFVKEQSLSPGEFVFHEQTVEDSSIFVILEGTAGLLQGDSTHSTHVKPIQNYIKILSKNDIFGQVSFFTGLERETSVIAVDFLRVGKISRKDLLSVVSKDKFDMERLAMLKDLFMVYQETNCFGVICESCGSLTHTVKDCPLTHLIFDRVKIVHRHIYSVENIRNPAVKRRGPARFRGPYVVMEKAEDIQEMLLEDNVCYAKLMELIQQVNLDGGDELINSEDDEDMEYEDEANGSNSDKDLNEDDDQQQHQAQQRMLGLDNYAKISNDYEDENLKQQMFKHARSTMNANYNASTFTNIANNTNLLNNNNNNNNILNQQYSTIFNNNYSNQNQMFNTTNNNNTTLNNAIISNNISGSGGRNNNDLSNTANNPHTTDNSSQLSKANVKSIRKNSSSSQIAVENVANKEFKNMTYNTMQTDQQFQSQEFLNDTVSNNNTIQGIGQVNNLNSLINLHNFTTNYNNTTSISNPNSINNINNNQASNSNSNSNNLNSLVNNANSAPINVNNQIGSSSNPINSHSNNNNNNNNPSNHGNQSSHNQSNHNNPSSQFISNHNNPSSYNPSIPSPVPLSGETRKSIPDIAAQNHLTYEQTQRIANKRLTTQTAPQIYSRTKSHASRKSQNQQKNTSGSPDNQQQSTEKNNQFQELMLDPSSVVREYNQDFTISSKKSKQKLKFADDQILPMQRSGEGAVGVAGGVAAGSSTAAFKTNNNSIPNSNMVNNPTNTSLQLSPYQESNSSKDNNNSNSQLIPNYILQQFQSLLLKFQLMFRQISQQKRDNSLQQALDKMNIEKQSDMVLDLPAHSGLKMIKENRGSDRKILQQMLGSSAYRGGIDPYGVYNSKNMSYQQQQQQQQQFSQLPGYYYSSQLPRYLDEFTLDIMQNFTIYFPHNNFEVIYPQLLLFQRFRVSQSPVLSPKRAPPSLIMYNPSHEQSMAPMSTLPIPLKPQYGGKVSSDRKTSSTNPSITKIRKSQYSLTYGVQMNQQKKRQILGSINSASSSMNNKGKLSAGQQENSSVEMRKQLEKGQRQSQTQNQEVLEQQREDIATKEIHLFPQT